ncbi:MAG: Flp pilus assembly complex ATPase component TadA [Candidatus Omnitrophica bacterium]|nr:Flp pilus assembly complex ATPase component TadA [Candidatus Omnitrophota bacterium]
MAVREKVGEILIKEGLITEEDLERAMEYQQKNGGKLGDVLIAMGLVTEKEIAAALGKQLGIPYVSISSGGLKPAEDQNLEQLIPEEIARKYLVLPISRTFNSLTIAVVDPLDFVTIDNIRKIAGCEVNPVITTKGELLQAIDEFYGPRDVFREAIQKSYEVKDIPTSTAGIEEIEEEVVSLDRLIAQAEEAPVVKLVDLIIRQAIEEGASDIHIEPMENRLRLRYRIDGVLHEKPPPAPHLKLAIVSRIKILSKLDIAEKRLPQDGSFIMKFENRMIDFRVSTIPTIYGEKVVIRILDRSRLPLDLTQLGFEPAQLDLFREAIRKPYGLIFLTGPTGSGKTTTLYAALEEINSPEKNIITIEDPVEYRLEGVNQVQVKPQIGLTFANALRSFLRQDPDIILVGEVRDLETAEICVRAALTGHLVLSTLHTNDSASAITRLIDVGIEPYLLNPSLLMVAAQRLVRILCPNCKEAYEPTEDVVKYLKVKKDLIFRAKGCEQCRYTGYKGRTAIYELIPVDDDVRTLITSRASAQEIKDLAEKKGYLSLWDSGIRKIEEGITSIEEVLRVTLIKEE